MSSDLIYHVAKLCLGLHVTMDPSVPSEVGCAEAVSYILHAANIPGIPAKGFASTDDLYAFLSTSSNFKPVANPTAGCIVISPTLTKKDGTVLHGHTGVCCLYGICSNDSDTGKFKENYSYESWKASFAARGLETFYFEACDTPIPVIK